MTVFLIIDETNFYQADFVAELLRSGRHDFVGCALVVKVPRKNNIERYMLRNFSYLTLGEFVKLAFRKVKYSLYNRIGFGKPKHFYSVKSALAYYNIPHFTVKNDVNEKVYLDRIRRFSPEVVLSSNSLYFKKELLSIPKFCINRHSSLLPSYGGLWPVFQALRNGEEYVGVTVHLMSEKIDEGRVLAQRKIKIAEQDTVDRLYQKCFRTSANVCLEALDALSFPYPPTLKPDPAAKKSYYGFPTKEQWKEFRANGKKFT